MTSMDLKNTTLVEERMLYGGLSEQNVMMEKTKLWYCWHRRISPLAVLWKIVS